MYTYYAALFLLIPLATQQEANEVNKTYLIQSDSKMNSINDFIRIAEFNAQCGEGCLKSLILTLRASLVSGNNYERLVNTCERIRELYECMNRINECRPNYLFRIFMDGLQYMCVEHPDVSRDLMECMDLHSQIIIKDCEQNCKVSKLMAGWFIHSIMKSTTLLKPDENGAPPRVNVGFFRKIASEACSISECYFLCLKTKYNTRCHGIGGNLLMEVMIRPLYRIHKSVLLGPFWNLVSLMMPSECNFMMSNDQIIDQRIDPKLDKNLKDFYRNRTEPLIKFRPPLGNFTEPGKSLYQDRMKRTDENNDMKSLVMPRNRNKMKAVERNNIGKNNMGESLEKYDEDYDGK